MRTKGSKWLWRVAVACFTVGLLGTLSPAHADIAVGGATFSWEQVVLLVGVGAAWGDMRRQVSDLRRDFDKFTNPKGVR